MAKSSKKTFKTYQAAYRQRDPEWKKIMNADHQKAHRQRKKQDLEKRIKEREKIKERVQKYRLKKITSAKIVNFSTFLECSNKRKFTQESPKNIA